MDFLTKLKNFLTHLGQILKRELFFISKLSRLYLDSTAFFLKKEHLYFLIGKEYAHSNFPTEPTPHLNKLIDEYKKITHTHEEVKVKLANVKRY